MNWIDRVVTRMAGEPGRQGGVARWVENLVVLLAGIVASFTIIYVAWHVARWVGR
jgi:hypothetical protein